jgi:hypothetical protein
MIKRISLIALAVIGIGTVGTILTQAFAIVLPVLALLPYYTVLGIQEQEIHINGKGG